jgi:hypothetical protein
MRFGSSLFRTKDQANRRILARLHPVFPCIVEIQMHLARIRVAESSSFEINDDKAAQPSMEEHEINAEPGIVDAKSSLTA